MKLVFPDEDALKVKELSEFLYYFSAAYTVAVERYGDITPQEIIANSDYYAQEFRTILFQIGSQHQDSVKQLFSTDLFDDEFLVDEMTRNSPLSFFGKGVVTAVILSVIISGGKVNAFGIEAEMQPLGVGVKLLREAFSDEPEPEPEIKILPQDSNPPTPTQGM